MHMQIHFKKLWLVVLATMLAGSAMAEQLTVQQALNRARGQRHLAPSRNGVESDFQLTYTAVQNNNNCYYVVSDAANGGFTVLAADDCAPAVLAQFEGADFDLNNMPVQMRGMLNHYQNLISTAISTGRTIRKVAPAGGTDIAPMIRTVWQQAAPYNNDCTELLNAGLVSSEQKSLTGCVATAMAQCLYYFYDKYGHEAQPSGNVNYTIEYKNESGSGIKAGNVNVNKTFGAADAIDWANMILMYDGFEYSAAQSAAVAKLMHMVGLSVQMQYEDSDAGSGTTDDNIPEAFKNNWGFDNGVEYIEPDGYTSQQWTNLIFNELKAARPVMYGAVARQSDGTEGGGHEFVIDGYRTSDDLYHVNWGWENGYCNGWCYLTNSDITKVLKPVANGDGSTGTADSSNDPYALGHVAIIGIQPKNFASMTAVTPKGKNGTMKIEDSSAKIVSYTSTNTLENATVQYTREFSGKWQALYVPFAIPASCLTDFVVAEPTKSTSSAVTISTVTETQANQIYFIKAKTSGKKTITVNNATLVPAAKNTKTVGSVTFTGTNSYILSNDWNKLWYAMGKNGSLVHAHDELVAIVDNVILLPNRWYVSTTSGVKELMIVDEDETTGIVTVETLPLSGEAYNLSGQRVSADTKGILIVNGKKVFNK